MIATTLHRTDPQIPLTTTHLLDSLRDSNDNRTWSDFDKRYRTIIKRLARARGLTDDQAEDAAQLTMLAFFRAHQTGQFDSSRGRLRSYILTIANTKIIDEWRKRRFSDNSQGQSALGSLPATPPDANPPMRTTFVGVTTKPLDLLRSQGRLSEQTLQVFELTVLHGVPAPAAAGICGISENSVYLAKHRALLKLRTLLAQQSSQRDAA